MLIKKEDAAQSEPYFNPHVAALPKYNAGLGPDAARAASGLETIARLASNENPYGCSPKVMQALGDGSIEPWRYSDSGCRKLRQALAASLDVDAETLVIGNGSEEMIAAASRAFLGNEAEALTVSPCFGLHEIEPMAVGARVTKVPMTASYEFDVDGLVRALAQHPDLLFLPSPWNPVGPALDRAALARVIDATSPSTLFVLDEAYFEFTSDAIPDGLEMLRASGRSYIVLRTFSKAFGLAGLRVGYAICSSVKLARQLAVAKTPFNVNAAAQAAAVIALGDQQWMRDAAQKILAERERVAQSLADLGLGVARSEGNFLFVDCIQSSTSVANDLLAAGVIVKPWMEAPYQHFIRVSIGTPAENDQFLDAMTAIVSRVQPRIAPAA